MSLLRMINNNIKDFMKENDFIRKNNNYSRIQNNLSFNVKLEETQSMVYVWFYIMPDYITSDNIYYTYGNRVSALNCVRFLPLSRNASKTEIYEWCSQLCTCLNKIIFPFFDSVSSPEKLIRFAKKITPGNEFLFCTKMELSRLCFMTYIFLNDKDNAKKEMKVYRKSILETTHLTEHIKKRYLDELNSIQEYNS